MHQAELLTPFAAAHTCFFPEEPFHGSLTSACPSADLRESFAAARIRYKQLSDSLSSGIRQMRKLQWHHLNALKLVNDYLRQMALPCGCLAQGMNAARMKN